MPSSNNNLWADTKVLESSLVNVFQMDGFCYAYNFFVNMLIYNEMFLSRNNFNRKNF